MQPLRDVRVLTLAVNLPGPLAAARLRQLGAVVVKVEPPQGDPLETARAGWYRRLHEGVEILRLNLKVPQDQARLHDELTRADLLLTSTRPAALRRLGLSWDELHARYPRLTQVAIVGHPPPEEELPGHDLTYQARLGLVAPPELPRTLLADLGGAQEAVSAALGLILMRERGQGSHYASVSLANAAAFFAEPLRQGMTAPDGTLGGGWPGYNVYRAREGWVAIAALEPHFWKRLNEELGVATPTWEQLQTVFRTRTAREWEAWGAARDLPLAALRDVSPAEEDRR